MSDTLLATDPEVESANHRGRPAKVSAQEVEGAVEELRRRGDPTTAGAIRRLLGKGSERKINELLAQVPSGRAVIKVDPSLDSGLQKAFHDALQARTRVIEQDFQRQLDHLSDCLAKQELATREAEQDKFDLQDALAAKTSECDLLAGQLLKANEMLDAVQADSSAKDAQLQELHKALAVADERLETSNRISQTAEVENGQLNAKLAALAQQNAETERQLVSLKGQLDGLLHGQSLRPRGEEQSERKPPDDYDPDMDDIPF